MDGHLDEKQFLYLVEAYCERVRNDNSLEPFFGDMEIERLKSLQQEFIFAALLRQRERNCRLNICEIFEKTSDNEFDSLLDHFQQALTESPVSGEVYDICQIYLHETRQGCESGKGMDYSNCPMCALMTPVSPYSVDSVDSKKKKGIRGVFQKLKGNSFRIGGQS